MTAPGEVEQPSHIPPAVCHSVMLGCFTRCRLGVMHEHRGLLRHKVRKLVACHQK